MASTAGQEVRGGVPAHSGDPSHKYPLELQKLVIATLVCIWTYLHGFGYLFILLNIWHLLFVDLFQWLHIKVKRESVYLDLASANCF